MKTYPACFLLCRSPSVVHSTSLPTEPAQSRHQQEFYTSENMVKTVGKYQVGRTIGEGTFGKVKLAINTETGDKMAIKVGQRLLARVCRIQVQHSTCRFGLPMKQHGIVRATRTPPLLRLAVCVVGSGGVEWSSSRPCGFCTECI